MLDLEGEVRTKVCTKPAKPVVPPLEPKTSIAGTTLSSSCSLLLCPCSSYSSLCLFSSSNCVLCVSLMPLFARLRSSFRWWMSFVTSSFVVLEVHAEDKLEHEADVEHIGHRYHNDDQLGANH